MAELRLHDAETGEVYSVDWGDLCDIRPNGSGSVAIWMNTDGGAGSFYFRENPEEIRRLLLPAELR